MHEPEQGGKKRYPRNCNGVECCAGKVSLKGKCECQLQEKIQGNRIDYMNDDIDQMISPGIVAIKIVVQCKRQSGYRAV